MNKDKANGDVPKNSWHLWRCLLLAFVWAWVLLILGISAAGAVAFVVYDHVTRPGHKGSAVEVVIPPGATGRDIGRILANNQLIEYEGFFRLAIELEGSDTPIKHGAYELFRGLSARELLHLLLQGPSRHLTANQYKITIPEGLSISQTDELLEADGAFVEAARNSDSMGRLGILADTLEGFLMPNTYFFDEKPEPPALIERMIDQFEKDYKILLAQNPGAQHLDKMHVVTIASLVERETRVEEERSLVAQVVYNRLKMDMPLQLDSTLQYILNKYGQRMLNQDREAQSPYNTYLNRGLPPGPICSPGKSSLRAAMAPADVPFLYFVSNADGRTHTFSATLEEHNRAVARFRRDIAPQRNALRAGQ